MVGIVAPVIAGLVTGTAFIAIFALAQPDGLDQSSLHLTESGQVLFIDTSYVVSAEGVDSRFNGVNKIVIDVMLQNATVVELMEGRNIVIGGIGHFKCSTGSSCALVILHHVEDLSKSAHVFIDYSNDKVLRFEKSDDW